MDSIIINKPSDYGYDLMARLNEEKRFALAMRLREITDEREKILTVKKFFADYHYDYGRLVNGLAGKDFKEFIMDGKQYIAHSFAMGECGVPLSPSIHMTKLLQCGSATMDVAAVLNASGLSTVATGIESAPVFNKFKKKLCYTSHAFAQSNLKNGEKINIDIAGMIMGRDAKEMGCYKIYRELEQFNTKF